MTKNPGDGVYSGSTCKQGEIEAVVIATGVHTFFGKAAHLVDSTNQVGHFQKVRTFFSNSRDCKCNNGKKKRRDQVGFVSSMYLLYIFFEITLVAFLCLFQKVFCSKVEVCGKRVIIFL